MTLLVKNEVDIIRDTLRFHLQGGVDHIVLTDNGSTDGTVEIVEEFVRMGVVDLIHEADQDYSQSTWVTRMALFARDRYAPDWIINSDADEFWYHPSSSLKQAVLDQLANVLQLSRRNMLLPLEVRPATSSVMNLVDAGAQESPVEAMTMAVMTWSGTPAESDMDRYILWRLGPKVMFRAAHLKSVAFGNHDVELDTEKVVEPLGGGIIYHYPIRSFSQFEAKVVQGAEAIERNPSLSKSIGFHWREWLKTYRRGELRDAYERTILTPDIRARLLRTGQLQRDSTVSDIVKGLPIAQGA